MKRFLAVLMLVLMCVTIITGCSKDAGMGENLSYEDSEFVSDYVEITEDDCIHYEEIKALLEPEGNDDMALPVVRGDNTVYQMKPGFYMHDSGKAQVYVDSSVIYPFSVVASHIQANPFALLGVLNKNGYIKERENSENDTTFRYTNNIESNKVILYSKVLDVNKKLYPYTQEGCEEFLDAVYALTKADYGNLHLLRKNEEEICGVNEPLYYSKKDSCYYTYRLFYDVCRTNIIAMYMRSDDNEYITDVEFQLMDGEVATGNYAAGISLANEQSANANTFESVSLMSAIERLLTGDFYLNNLPMDHTEEEYSIPDEYDVADFHATFSKTTYETIADKDGFEDLEYIHVTNYRIRK